PVPWDLKSDGSPKEKGTQEDGGWTPEAEQQFTELQAELFSATVLALPNYQKPFIKTVDCKASFMTSVLLQPRGNKLKPVVHYSKGLDPVRTTAPLYSKQQLY
uniref:Reverse transcriptase/retrotransposon-derived protein RNase H-like domain-containing protein n=1 Tax=Cyprinodon variegatus TaxID=28743 RepID=A0A3Q2CJJ1_CYPVA